HRDQHIVHHDGGDLVVGLAQRAPEGAQHREIRARLEVVELGEHPLQVGGLVLERRLGQFQVALHHGRAEDDLPAHADGGRLRPGGERRHLDRGVPRGRRAAGEPPAGLEFFGAVRPDVQAGRRRSVAVNPYPALFAGPVPAAGRVDRDAVPARRVEQRHAVRHPDGPLIEKQIYPNGLGCLFRCHCCCWARKARIQFAPQSSRPSTRSAALTARTICGVLASMIALVRPCDMAAGRNAALIVCRSGMPKLTFDAPSVMFTPNSSRIIAIVSMVRVGCRVSAPTGIASGSITMSDMSMPYFSVATWMSLRVSSRRRAGSVGISSSSFGSPMTAAPYFLTRGR